MKIEVDNLIDKCGNSKRKRCQVFDLETVQIHEGIVVFGKYQYDLLKDALERNNQVIQVIQVSNNDPNKVALNYPDLDLLKDSRVTVICDDHYREVYQGLLKDKSPEKLMMKPTFQNISSYVILLMRDLNRVSHVHQKLTTTLTKMRIFPAIDALTPHAIDDCVQTHKLPIMKPIRAGRIGCLFSHLSLWKELLASKSRPAMMILEDDNMLVNGFVEKFNRVLEELPPTFDLLHLYRVDGSGQDLIEKIPLQQTCAYLISRKGADRLVKVVKSIKEPLEMILEKQVENGYLEGYAVSESLFENAGDADSRSVEEKLKSNTSDSQLYVPDSDGEE